MGGGDGTTRCKTDDAATPPRGTQRGVKKEGRARNPKSRRASERIRRKRAREKEERGERRESRDEINDSQDATDGLTKRHAAGQDGDLSNHKQKNDL